MKYLLDLKWVTQLFQLNLLQSQFLPQQVLFLLHECQFFPILLPQFQFLSHNTVLLEISHRLMHSEHFTIFLLRKPFFIAEVAENGTGSSRTSYLSEFVSNPYLFALFDTHLWFQTLDKAVSTSPLLFAPFERLLRQKSDTELRRTRKRFKRCLN